MNDWIEKHNAQQAQLDADDQAAKRAGTLVGRYIQHPCADSYAVYKITHQGPTKVSISWVDIGDAWVLPAWGKKATISLSQARGFLQQRDALAELFDRQVDWWEQQKLGDVVHYHNSFGAYVRGIIVQREGKKQMLPTALVGNWMACDLPKRRPDGRIHRPYHAKNIFDGETMQPHASNMFECPEFSLKGAADPRTLPPINLEPPPPTVAETKLAAIVGLHTKVSAALETGHYADTASAIKAYRSALLAAKAALKDFE